MIEIIYKDEAADTKQDTAIKIPKNIRQIGSGSFGKKVYIEDYVMTCLKKQPKDEDTIKYGVLLGSIKQGSGNTYIFVNGVVEAPVTRHEAVFNETIWSQLYEDIYQYFGDLEITGWFLSIPYKMRDNVMSMQKIHLDNFAGSNRICFFFDRSENDEGFYMYEHSRMNRQPGYYIYYDKNEKMQNYFIEKNLNEEENEKELKKPQIRQTAGSFRTMLQESREKSSSLNGQIIKAGAMVATVALLVTAISSLNNYGDIKNINGAINKIASIVTKDDKESGPNDTVIEVAGNDIKNKPAERKSGEKSSKEKATTKESETHPETTTAPQETKKASKDVSYYTVKKSETLLSICMKVYNDANMLEELRKANDLDSEYTIVEGQKLILP